MESNSANNEVPSGQTDGSAVKNGEFLSAQSNSNQQSGRKWRIYKIVLTGGPCGGKTTGQGRLATFFEGLGWKVYLVPETATILLNGGIRFADLSDVQRERFQEDLLLTLLRIEDVYFHLAEGASNEDHPRNVLVICDRGTMDGSAYVDHDTFDKILIRNRLNVIELRDGRYDQIIHMMTAAIGAEAYYSTASNIARSEGVRMASDIDTKTRQVWIGHQHFDVIDNQTTDFDDKIRRLIQVVCDRAGIQYGDRLKPNSKKRKFLVSGFVGEFPRYEEFDVEHHYLSVVKEDEQARIRKRGQGGKFFYTHTTRRMVAGERVETGMQVTQREYEAMKLQADPARVGTKKKRRCFFHGQTYFQLDIYEQVPRGMPQLMILETFTTDSSPQFSELPPFLKITQEITSDPQYSMYNLSLKK